MITSDLIDKHGVHQGRVQGERALIAFRTTLWDDPIREHTHYARIPEGYRVVETLMDYVGLVNEQTGEARELTWELLPDDARVEIETTLP